MKFQFTNIENKEQIVIETDDLKLIVGRSSISQIVLSDESISRQHCLIEKEEDLFFITDLKSANGVYIDSVKIGPNIRTPITLYNQIQLGKFECKIIDESINEDQKEVKTNKISFNPSSLNIRHSQVSPQIKKSLPKRKYYLFILPVLIFTGIVIYQFTQKREDEFIEEIVDSPPIEKIEVIDEKINQSLENNQVSKIDYLALSQSSNCQFDLDYCNVLGLSAELGEGIKRENDTFFIFINPSLRDTSDKNRSFLKMENGSEILATELLLKSVVFAEFLEGKISKIHLVVMKTKEKVSSVFFFDKEFYPSHFRLNQMIDDIELMLMEEKAGQFFINYGRIIPKVYPLE